MHNNAPVKLGDSAPEIPQGHAPATMGDFAVSVDTIVARKATLNQVMQKVMKDGTHYGKIQGCGDKPTLLKPGAEAISSTFQLCPRYQVAKTEIGNGHREYEVICELLTPGGGFVGSGVGSCTTMEGKYRFRRAGHKCPQCGKEDTIIKGKQEYGGGWVCFNRKGGCGAKFSDGDERIENQDIGRVEHDNPADYYNTVLKMAKKRAFVDAVLTATGASDIFTQDIEDMPETIPGARATQQQRGQATDGMDDMPPDWGGQRSQGQSQQRGGQSVKSSVFSECKSRGIDLNDLCRSLSDENSFGRSVGRVTDLAENELGDLLSWLRDGSLDFLRKNAA